MKRLLLIVAVVGIQTGCDFLRGARDEGVRQGAGLGAELAAERLGKDFDELKDALRELPSKLPAADPAGGSALYGLGTLAALLLANGAKGYIRQKAKEKADDLGS